MREVKTHIQILGSLVAIMWVIEILNGVFFQHSLLQFGIVPRDPTGLRGIVLAPFLHGGFKHLIANTVPFVVLGWFVMIRATADFFTVSLITMGVSGLGTWLFGGAQTVHVGASGLIFGFLGYLLLRGYFERSFSAIFLSVIVALLYGSLIAGVLPSDQGISWQGHLFGFIGGGIAARYLARPKLSGS